MSVTVETAEFGATARASGGTTFAVFARADRLRVRLEHPGTRELRIHEMRRAGDGPESEGVWTVHAEADYHGWSYAYDLEREGRSLGGIIDPCARLVRMGRGYVWRDGHTVTPRPAMDPRDAVIYELHVRDFTNHHTSGVSPRLRGKYLGLCERGTRASGTSGKAAGGEVRTGLDHILELGVNVVQLMPVHAFSMPYDPDYEWGYMPHDYNAPEETYASGTGLGEPIRELKQLVSALHEAGLRVTLDVVYNHDAEEWPGKLRSLMALAPRDYFRFREDGTPWDGSACGNEFRSESPAGRRFIRDSCSYWVREFGIDGYRFDLMGLIDAETMGLIASDLRGIDPTVLVYGEPWAGGAAGIEVTGKGAQRSRGWGVFNDEMRDALRGYVFEIEDEGFLTAGRRVEQLRLGVFGGTRSFADGPLEAVNYAECHDNHTLADRLSLVTGREGREGPRVTGAARRRMSQLAMLVLATSAGTPFLHAGQEFAREKDGEDNTYNLGDAVNNIDWRDKARAVGLYGYYRRAIALRREHPMLRPGTREEVEASFELLDEGLGIKLPEGVLAWRVRDASGEDAWRELVVVVNGGRRSKRVVLPEGPWKVRLRDETWYDGEEEELEGSVRVGGRCGAVVFR